ncbi:hypothetical protein [Daejeonella sp.]|uniref:hypothetical protein n=1 Tax=Daejeonella sp. TaxID=2805397 RepID=UPI0030BE9179
MKLRFVNPKHYYIEFLKFKNYILNPVYIESNKNTILQNISGTWNIVVIKIILTIIVGIVATLIYDPVNKTTERWLELYSTGTIFLLSIIIFPLLEEIAFRLSLKFRQVYLSLTLGVLAYYMVTKGFYQTKLSNIDNHFEIRLMIGVLTILIPYAIITSNPKIKSGLDRFWKRNFKWVFYFFCITFAFIHIFNYELNLKHLLLLPLITLPKLVSAITYGYVRMHYGFIYSLGLHMFSNSLGFVQIIYFSGGGTD